jgi:uncharacterized damage-inducible protein DinB
MQAIALIRRLREHQLFARDRLVACARGLSDEQLRQRFAIGMGSVLDSLVHLYAAEFCWLAALEGDPAQSPFKIRFDSFAALLDAWPTLDARWAAWYAQLSEAQLDQPVTKISSLAPPGSPPMVTPTHDVLLHVYTHAHYTVAQVTNMFRQLGVSPTPDTMMITLSRMQAKG